MGAPEGSSTRAHPDLADCVHHVLALRDQNIDLPQLRNDLFRLVSLPCHYSGGGSPPPSPEVPTARNWDPYSNCQFDTGAPIPIVNCQFPIPNWLYGTLCRRQLKPYRDPITPALPGIFSLLRSFTPSFSSLLRIREMLYVPIDNFALRAANFVTHQHKWFASSFHCSHRPDNRHSLQAFRLNLVRT